MSLPEQPRLRRVDSIPVKQADGQVAFALRDPEGFSGSIMIPHAAAALAPLLAGTRTLGELQADYQKQFGQEVDLADIEQLVADLDHRLLLDTPEFRRQWKLAIEQYLNAPVRQAAHAGAAYASQPEALCSQLAGLFSAEKGPGMPGDSTASTLRGVLSPHIDLQRGGPAFAFAYRRLIEQCDADLFVIFGTAHNPLRNPFSVSKKHFETPLGVVETDRQFVGRLASTLAAMPAGKDLNLYSDELAHRQEHSLEFQVVFLQYLLAGRRPFKVVPVLAGSFGEFVRARRLPASDPVVMAFVQAMHKTAAGHAGKVAYIGAGDLAHIGRRFGDRDFLTPERLREQAQDDQKLLEAASRADANAFFMHVADRADRDRICGLAPIYTMLEVMRPARGELLKYDQAVELDGSSCVSFASMAFYGE